ncbi:hypothetical protein [Streptomyces sp. N2A]|uniref:hypothetical protein n=1 Tax=Streptomyces sp. N2A TaxID=3073936 RepID=UPI002870239F|nr:hypothetical protein [Streptomyces sp. N2A]
MAERSPRDPRDPLDEEAAWAEIVAGYGKQPSFPAADDDAPAKRPDEDGGAKDRKGGPGDPGKAGTDRPGSFVVYAPGVGPRDWNAAEPSDDDFDETDEGHFTPPEPPPLPKADVTSKFAWIAVLGGPLLLIAMVIFQQPVTWWSTVLGIGGFLGGFATLVARMKHDDEDDDQLPGGGAVV